ncbi:MAG: hypothetical protein HYT22_02350 [Candidatus Niyogibacteria bacterium]|nr:hypothetical protein [Candidatus Niyogibacteria bacterium]
MNKKSTQTLELAPDTNLPPAEGRANKREGTRSQIALYYVLGFLILILLALILSFAYRLTINDLRDTLLALSGILSGPLGFIIGYYFKSYSDRE